MKRYAQDGCGIVHTFLIRKVCKNIEFSHIIHRIYTVFSYRRIVSAILEVRMYRDDRRRLNVD